VKKILIAFVFVATTAIAAPPPAEVVLKAKDGNVTFNHKAHQSQGCKNCHGAGAPGKIEGLEKKAHELCSGCHKEKGKGPQFVAADTKTCGACHKK
jgi:predicted CXXCH cytochrome family protein